jgi:hypothetical protein
MKYLAMYFFIATVLMSCGNADNKAKDKDSANVLQDTLPAKISIDSNPADATHVDSLNNMSR